MNDRLMIFFIAMDPEIIIHLACRLWDKMKRRMIGSSLLICFASPLLICGWRVPYNVLLFRFIKFTLNE